MDWILAIFAQAGDVARASSDAGFWGGAGIGGTVAGGGVFALFLWYLDRKDDKHNKAMEEIGRAMGAAATAAATEAKEARERYQQLLSADHADTKELTGAMVGLMAEQRALTAALTAVSTEQRALSTLTAGLVSEVKSWRKRDER